MIDGCRFLARYRAVGILHKDPLQHVALDRFLQDRHAGKPGIDGLGVVAGDEDERHAAFRQYFGDRIDQPVAEIDVEHRGIEVLFTRRGQRLRRRRYRADHLETEFRETVADHHGDQRLVLDQKYARLVFAVVQIDHGDIAVAAVAHRTERPRFRQFAARDRDQATQTRRVPLEDRLAAELLLDAGGDHFEPEVARGRPPDARSAILDPA